MEKKFSGKIWRFGNDIDTDTNYPREKEVRSRIEMKCKKYAFELLKPAIWLNSPAGRYPGSRYQLWLRFQP